MPELKRQKASCLYERLALSRDKAGIKRLAAEGQIVTRPEDVLKEPLVLEFLGLEEKSATPRPTSNPPSSTTWRNSSSNSARASSSRPASAASPSTRTTTSWTSSSSRTHHRMTTMSQESLISFEKTDRLDLKQFCERLENYLLVEHDYVEGGLVVALNAGFGAGKTTFVRMWENDLRSRREKGEFVPMPLVLNAWESDYGGDPLLAILANLIEAIGEWDGGDKEDEKSALKEAAKNMAWFALGLGNGVAAKFTGVDAVKAGDFAEGKKTARKSKRPDFIELYHQRADALKILKEKLAGTFGGESPKIFVFIDELDRCRPDYAVG